MTSARVNPVVLVVDDHEAGRFAKSGILRRAGFEVTVASTGREALDAAVRLGPDLVVLDVNLPDMSGLEVCRRLKAAPGVPPQVLQVSATAIADEDRVAGLAQGADTYLIEPVTPEILIATSRALLRVRRTEQALFDLAERERRAREDAERANRSKDEFLATLSHELRSPLNAMSGWLWQLQRQPDNVDIRHRALEAIDRNLKMQARLIDDLLDISRIEKGKVDLAVRLIDLRALASEAFEALRARGGGRTIELHLPTDPVPVMADRQRLAQVLDNLLNNALQFTPAAGRIVGTLSEDATSATLTIEDSGAGIDPAFLPFIFESFRQADGSSTRRSGGLGLGLSIVKQLVELHGGSVEARSEGPGCGATFTIRVPTVRDAPIAIPRSETREVRLQGVTVLVVEDDGDARELMGAMLTAAGGAVTTASTAAEALRVLDGRRFDVIVSDIAMADQDGLAMIRAVRAMGVHTPAIAVTALSTDRDRQRTSEAGFSLHLAKPVDQATLVHGIAGLLPD